MTLNMNQFGPEPVAGDITNAGTGMVISAQVSPSAGSAVVAAEALKLVSTSSAAGVPVVTPVTALTDVIYCVAIRSLKNATFTAGKPLEIAMRNTIIWMTAGAAIDAGKFVEYDYTTKKVKVNTTIGRDAIGIAQNKVTADGDLIRILLSVPNTESISA